MSKTANLRYGRFTPNQPHKPPLPGFPPPPEASGAEASLSRASRKREADLASSREGLALHTSLPPPAPDVAPTEAHVQGSPEESLPAWYTHTPPAKLGHRMVNLSSLPEGKLKSEERKLGITAKWCIFSG